MSQRKTYRGLDWFALYFLRLPSISDSFGDQNPEIAQMIRQNAMQYWISQSNSSVVFATVSASIFVGLLTNRKSHAEIIAYIFFLTFIYFGIRAWAFGRCAKITCNLWL